MIFAIYNLRDVKKIAVYVISMKKFYPLNFRIRSVDQTRQHHEKQQWHDHHQDHWAEQEISNSPCFSLLKIFRWLASTKFQRILDRLNGAWLQKLQFSCSDFPFRIHVDTDGLEEEIFVRNFNNVRACRHMGNEVAVFSATKRNNVEQKAKQK